MPKEKIKQFLRYEKIKAWYLKYERVLMPVTLVFGVVVDSITFTSIDTTTAFIMLGIYTVLVGGVMVYLNAYEAQRISHEKSFFRYLRLVAPLLIQFFFGALLSAAFIFYLFSGTVFVSWPFIIIILFLMIANDVFRQYYLKPLVQVSVYFFILFSVTSIILPFVLEDFGLDIFVASGVISVLLIAGYIYGLMSIVPALKLQKKRIVMPLIAICIVLNALYLLNLIPPVPLSIREAFVAHDLSRQGGEYVLQLEKESFVEKIIPGKKIELVPGKPLYVFTAIFAPGTLQTTIVHHWQHYDEEARSWTSDDRLSFFIAGGRQEGYRGYSVKTNVPEGRWRVDVETVRGQVLGRVQFDVVHVNEMPELVEVVE